MCVDAQLKQWFPAIHRIKLDKRTKPSDISNYDFNFSGVRFICSPHLAIKSALASLGLTMTKCRPQMGLPPSK